MVFKVNLWPSYYRCEECDESVGMSYNTWNIEFIKNLNIFKYVITVTTGIYVNSLNLMIWFLGKL